MGLIDWAFSFFYIGWQAFLIPIDVCFFRRRAHIMVWASSLTSFSFVLRSTSVGLIRFFPLVKILDIGGLGLRRCAAEIR